MDAQYDDALSVLGLILGEGVLVVRSAAVQ